MNNLAKTYFKQVHQALDGLQDALKKQREENTAQKQEYERLTKEFWSSGKEAAVLKERLASFGEMKEENERLRAVRTELNDRLMQILEYTKALGDEFRT